MIKPLKLLRDEQKKLLNEYFKRYPDDEREYYSVDEERLGDYFGEEFKNYINDELIRTNIGMRIVPI